MNYLNTVAIDAKWRCQQVAEEMLKQGYEAEKPYKAYLLDGDAFKYFKNQECVISKSHLKKPDGSDAYTLFWIDKDTGKKHEMFWSFDEEEVKAIVNEAVEAKIAACEEWVEAEIEELKKKLV